MLSAESALKHACESHNIIYLNNRQVTIGKVTFFGSTLWTHIPLTSASIIYNRVTAYSKIKGCTIDLTNACYKNSLGAITRFLDAPKNEDMMRVVITHYAPLTDPRVVGKFKEKRDNVAFATDIPDTVKRADWWIFGHTHFNSLFTIGTTTMFSNAFANIKRVRRDSQLLTKPVYAAT
jgi:hypothetical protein